MRFAAVVCAAVALGHWVGGLSTWQAIGLVAGACFALLQDLAAFNLTVAKGKRSE